MEWKVANALSRDVERQHLNKILKDIRLTIDSKQGSDIPDSRIRAIVSQMLPAPARPRSFTLSLVGDVEGSAVLGGSDTTLNTTLSVDVIEEAPNTGQAYWRRHGYWELVPESVYAIANVDDSGFIVTSLDTGEVFSRVIEGREGEVIVENGDGVDGNPVIGLADVPVVEGGSLIKVEFDDKGRRTHEDNATTDDLSEGVNNLYFTASRSYEAVGGILSSSEDVILTYDALVPEITAALHPDVWDVINSKTEVDLSSLEDAVDDEAADALGVEVGQIYRNGSQLMIRVS